MKASYRLSGKAAEDLFDLYRYGVRSFGLDRANRYYDSLVKRLEEIGNDPLRFPLTEYREGYRRSVHAPHAIYFRLGEDGTVEIIRILRGQDPRQL